MIRNWMISDHGLAAAIVVAGAVLNGPAAGQPLCGPSYFVERGDTLFGIADRCGTTVDALRTANPRLDPFGMHVGMRVRIPDVMMPGLNGSTREPSVYRRMSALSYIAEIRGIPVEELIADDGTLVASEDPVGAEVEYGGEPGGKRLRVTGRITDEGVECPVLRSKDGKLYSLAGDIGDHDVGDRVTVTGKQAEMSFCMRGTAIDVSRINPAQ